MKQRSLFNLYLARTAGILSGARRVALLLLLTLLTTATAWADSTFSGGSGTSDDPYKINTPTDLNQLAADVNSGTKYQGKYFKLGDNIEYDKNTANNFTPIGKVNYGFYGTFDGQGYTISGININSGGAYDQGIFGFVNGTVKNLHVSNCSIVAYQEIGAIAGYLRQGTIENCHVSDDVTLIGHSYVGGIAGHSEGGTIKGCTSAATITGTTYSGIKAFRLGGVVGATASDPSSTLTDNIFTGAITGNLKEYIGAIVGQNNSGTLTNNHYTSAGFGGIGAEGSTTGADGDGATVLDWATQSNGNSEATAYMIYNKEQLDLLAQRVNAGTSYYGKYFKLGADITYTYTKAWNDATSTENNYTAIGYEDANNDRYFSGKFDGQGHTISGIRIYKYGNKKTEKNQGLFGQTSSSAEVKNVILADARITGYDDTGGIVGYNGGKVTNCHVTSDVTIHAAIGASSHGGIAGRNIGTDAATITGCTSAAALTTHTDFRSSYVGGITGDNSGGIVTNCLYLGTTLEGYSRAGAIVGNNSGTVENCYFTDTNITGKDNNSANALTNAESAVGYNEDNGNSTNCGLAHKVSLDTGVTLGGTATPYGPLTAYGNFALAYNDGTSTTIYSTEGSVITLGNYSGTAPEGYTFGGYTATNGGTINGNATVGYTLTMPAADVTVSAVLTPDIATYWHADADHDGSEAKPYIISTTTGLNLLAAQVNSGNLYIGKYFKLDANIEYDKSKKNNFTPIGNNDYGFYGTFDGDGNSISGININIDIPSNDAQYQGIFGHLNGTVKNLVVSSSSIAARRMIGAIAGHFQGGTIKNCHVGNDVTLSGLLYVGGIVGNSEKGTIQGCTSAATITGAKYSSTYTHRLGGIVGATTTSNPSTLTDNIFTGAINGNLNQFIGAIVGEVEENASGTLTNNVYTSTGFSGIGAEGSTTGADGAGARKALTISAANGVTLTPVGTATTNNLSGITTYADNSVMGYDNKLYACATEAAKLSIAYTVPSGYEFNKIDAGEGVTVTASGNAYTITMPASDVTVDVDFDVIEYTLQYNGIDQATFVNSNPTTYTVESNAITLFNPTRTGYTFAGWTGTGLDAATMTVTIAKGSTGAKSYTATWKKLLTNTDIKVSAIADQTYTGSAFTPSVTVMDGETDITDQCDVAYSDNTNAGTATVTVTAKTAGNYSGEIKTTFNIVAKTVSTLTITLSATEYVYDGQAKEPAVSSVKVGDTVIPASEYTVAYENNTKAGTATVKIVDKDGGNYTVSGSATFEIVLMGDANGDKKVDAADIVRLVNDNAPQSDIDEVVKIIMQNK
jgi:uncharacterized repeat protein (TIGR02543 family)